MKHNTLGAHVKRFLDIKYNPQTRVWYAKYLRSMVESLGTSRAVDSVDRTDAEAYWHMLQAKNVCWDSHPHRPTELRRLSKTTLNNHLRAARTFWTEMISQRLVEYNPFDHLKPIRDNRPVEMKAIAADDLLAIWEAAKRSSMRDLAIVTILGTTGVRAGELVSMEISKIDLNKGLCWVNGKRGWRKLVLGAMGVQVIKSYLDERPEASTNRLWLNAYGNPLTTDGIRQIVDRLADSAGVTGRHNLHSFRHRTAQAWLNQGINAEIVAQLLGHADVSTTLRIYANQDERHVRAAMRQVEFSPFEVTDELEDSLFGERV